MSKLSFIHIILFFFSITGCHFEHQSKSQKVIDDLIEQYPLLNHLHNGMLATYTLERSIKDNVFNTQFELYTNSDPFSYNQKIILISKDNQFYAIPMFTSQQADYWNMDSVQQKNLTERVKTTFERELKNCNQKLKINKQRCVNKLPQRIGK